MEKLRICIIDSYEIFRFGVRYLLADSPYYEISAEAASKADGLKIAVEQKPDLIIMDVKLSDGSGIDACRNLKVALPEIKVIMLSTDPKDEVIFASILAGANGFLLKDIKGEDLIKAIKTVGQGESLLDPSITKKVLEHMKNSASEPHSSIELLNQQEKKILVLIAEGKTNKEIAGFLLLSDKTIKNYVSNILNKLSFNNRAEAAAYAVRNQLFAAEI